MGSSVTSGVFVGSLGSSVTSGAFVGSLGSSVTSGVFVPFTVTSFVGSMVGVAVTPAGVVAVGTVPVVVGFGVAVPIETLFFACFTIQETVAFFPLNVVAVIVVVPALFAETSPFLDTVAIDVSPERNVIDLLYPDVKETASGSTSLIASCKLPFSILIPFAAAFTTTLHVFFFVFTLAVITAVPFLYAFIFPFLLTVTTFLLLEEKRMPFVEPFKFNWKVSPAPTVTLLVIVNVSFALDTGTEFPNTLLSASVADNISVPILFCCLFAFIVFSFLISFILFWKI